MSTVSIGFLISGTSMRKKLCNVIDLLFNKNLDLIRFIVKEKRKIIKISYSGPWVRQAGPVGKVYIIARNIVFACI